MRTSLLSIVAVFNAYAAAQGGCDRALLDIRTFTRTGQAPGPERVYTLSIGGELGYLLTLAPRGSDAYLVQIFRHARANEFLEAAIMAFLERLGGQLSADPRNDGVLYRGLLRGVDPAHLEEHLRRASELLKDVMQSKTFLATSVRRDSSSRTARGLAATLERFLLTHGFDDEVGRHVATRRLTEAHTMLLDRLTTKEQTFFDYAFFDETPGYGAEYRANEREIAWVRLNPDDLETFAEVHERIRGKLLSVGAELRETSALRLDRFRRVRDRVHANLVKWFERNPIERLERFHRAARAGEVDVETLSELIGLEKDQHPPSNEFETATRRRRLRKVHEAHASGDDCEVPAPVHRLARMTLRGWARECPIEHLRRMKQLADFGIEDEDLAFVATLRHAFGIVSPWDRADLLESIAPERSPGNARTFGDVDQANLWREPTVKLTIESPAYVMSESSRDATAGAMPVAVRSHRRARFDWSTRRHE